MTLIDKILNGEVGINLGGEEDADIRRIASVFESMIDSGELALYEYKSGTDVYDYLISELDDGWTHLCLSTVDSHQDPPMLCGCKIGYFINGDGSNMSVVTLSDLIDDIMSRDKESDDKEIGLKFDSVF